MPARGDEQPRELLRLHSHRALFWQRIIKQLTDYQFTRITRTLAEPRRIRILREIAAHGNSMPLACLLRRHQVSAATLSHHANELDNSGLVEIIRHGKFVHLVLQPDVWRAYVKGLSDLIGGSDKSDMNRAGNTIRGEHLMKIRNATTGEMSMSAANSNSDLGALFDGHIAREFADFDVDATMETMVAEPYVHCVATLAGGFGGREVRRFYSEHFINQIPKDAKVTPISRTIGKDQVVDELIVSFTHNTQWDYLLPGIPPTGKKVDLPHVVVMKFENGKVAHEHVWWDQASLLVQVGLLDPANLPVVGIEQAKQLLRVAQRREDQSTAATTG